MAHAVAQTNKDGEPNPAEQATTFDLLLIFIIAIFIPITAYVVFSMPQLFEDIAIHQFQISTLKFETLYSIYSIPNFLAVPLGTLMLSFTGLGFGVVIFAALVYGGVLIMYAGFYFNNWWVVFFGRGFYGLGSENVTICAPTIFGKWFMGKALSVSLAVNRSFTQAMVSLSILLVPRVFERFRRMDEVFLVYCLLAFSSFVSSALYALFEHNFGNRSKKKKSRGGKGKAKRGRGTSGVSGLTSGKKTIGQETEMFTEFATTRNENKTIHTLKTQNEKIDGENYSEYDTERQPSRRSGVSQATRTTKTTIADLTEADRTFVAPDIQTFSPLFWMLGLVFAVGSMGAIMFDTFGTDFMMNRFGYTYDEGTLLYSTTAISTIICIPLFSFLTQAVGCKGVFLVIAHLIGILSFTVFIFLPPRPNQVVHFVLLLGIGVFNSLLLAVIWPCMTLSVPTRGTAVALGMATTLQNLLIFGLPLYFGQVNRARDVASYNSSLVSLAILVSASALLSIAAMIYDLRHGKLLHLPENSPKIAKQRRLLENGFLMYKLKKAQSVEREGSRTKFGTMADVQSRAERTELTEEFEKIRPKMKSGQVLPREVGDLFRRGEDEDDLPVGAGDEKTQNLLKNDEE